MCAQLGVIFGTAKRGRDDQEHRDKLFGWLFTYLLLLSEKRGPHATGMALLRSNGEHTLFKQPIKASDFIKGKGFREVLDGIDARTTLLVGHTRWQTVGDASNNENNHPIRAGNVIGTHNGTIFNADELFDLLGLPRCAEVDSELIFRIADATLDAGRLDMAAIRARLALCRGQVSAVLASLQDPATVLMIKGNKPLELRYHKEHRAIVYASDAGHLDVVLAKENGWRVLPTAPMSLLTFDCGDVPRCTSELFRLASSAPASRFRRFTAWDDDETSDD